MSEAAAVGASPIDEERWLGERARKMRRAAAALLPSRRMLFRIPSAVDCVYLTFDDGPHPVCSPVVLDTLARFNARATFFVVGREVQQYPEIVRRAHMDGHVIGNHSFSHAEPSSIGAIALAEEISRTNRLVFDLIGRTPRLVRPPKGKATVAKLLRLWWQDQTIVLWNRDPKDFMCDNPGHILARLQSPAIGAGDIVLLHDRVASTAAGLSAVLTYFADSGLRCEVLPWAYVGGGS